MATEKLTPEEVREAFRLHSRIMRLFSAWGSQPKEYPISHGSLTLDQLRRIDAILREGKPAPEGGKHG